MSRLICVCRLVRKIVVIQRNIVEQAMIGFYRRLPLGRIALLCTVLFLFGCDSRSELAQNVSQRQSLLIVSVLSKAGIEAAAQSGQGANGRFSIYVDQQNYARATSVLVESGLPAEEEQSLGELLQGSTFLPQTRLMENLRIDRALGLEIQDHLEALPYVTGAKVLVRTVPNGSINERGLSVLLFVEKGATTRQAVTGQPDKVLVDKAFVEQHVETMFPDLRLDRFKVSILEGAQSNKAVDGRGANIDPAVTERAILAGTIGEEGKTEDKNITRVPFLWLWTVKESQYATAAGVVLLFFLISGVVGADVTIWWMSYLSAHIRSSTTRTEDPRLPGLSSKKSDKQQARSGDKGNVLEDKSVTGTRRITGSGR